MFLNCDDDMCNLSTEFLPSSLVAMYFAHKNLKISKFAKHYMHRSSVIKCHHKNDVCTSISDVYLTMRYGYIG